jgi:ACS family sodium-dependent inorganic phosphate cotransporter
MAVASNGAGWFADTAVSKGYSITLVRKVMQSIGFLGPALCLSQLSSIHDPKLAVLCMMVSQVSPNPLFQLDLFYALGTCK